MRKARFGLYEVQRVERGCGTQVLDVHTGQSDFVHDVASSRQLRPGDGILTRLHQNAGQWQFVGEGPLVRPELLPQMRQWIAKESRAAGQTNTDFVRANSHRMYRVLVEMHAKQYDRLKRG